VNGLFITSAKLLFPTSPQMPSFRIYTARVFAEHNLIGCMHDYQYWLREVMV